MQARHRKSVRAKYKEAKDVVVFCLQAWYFKYSSRFAIKCLIWLANSEIDLYYLICDLNIKLIMVSIS